MSGIWFLGQHHFLGVYVQFHCVPSACSVVLHPTMPASHDGIGDFLFQNTKGRGDVPSCALLFPAIFQLARKLLLQDFSSLNLFLLLFFSLFSKNYLPRLFLVKKRGETKKQAKKNKQRSKHQKNQEKKQTNQKRREAFKGKTSGTSLPSPRPSRGLGRDLSDDRRGAKPAKSGGVGGFCFSGDFLFSPFLRGLLGNIFIFSFGGKN